MANETKTGVHNALPYQVISEADWSLRSGQDFGANTFFRTVVNNASCNILVITSAGKQVEWIHEINASGPMILSIYEGGSSNAYGTLVPSFNINRAFTTSASTLVYVGGSQSATSGTLIRNRLIVGTTGGEAIVNGGSLASHEWILRPGTEYLFSMIATAGTVIQGVNFLMHFSEL